MRRYLGKAKIRPYFWWWVIFVFFLSIFLRFYKTQDLFVFSGDEEHQLSISQTIVDNFHLEWVGVSSADTGFYLGPFWQYFGAFWLYFSHSNPSITAYVASAIGVAITLLVIVVGVNFFNWGVGLLAGGLYATLPLLVYYDRKFWNPALTSFVSLTLFLSLYKTNQSKWWWVMVFFLSAFIFHIHLSLVPLEVIVLFELVRQWREIPKKVLLSGSVIFLLVLSPLIGFDYFHKLSNFKAATGIFLAAKNQPSKINVLRNGQQLLRSMGRLWYLHPNRPNADEVLHDCSLYFNNRNLHAKGVTTFFSDARPFFSAVSLLFLLWFWLRKKTWRKVNTRLLALFLGLIILPYLFLPNSPLEYYLLGVFPLFLFIPGLFVEELRNKSLRRIIIVGLILISIFGVNTVLTATGDYGLLVKQKLIEEVMQTVGDNPYELEAGGLCHKYEGWRFLFKAYGRPPAKSYTDGMFGWLYKGGLVPEKSQYKVVVYEDRVGLKAPDGYVKVVASGGFKAYIYKE